MSMLSFIAESFEGKKPKRPSFASVDHESGHETDDHSSLHHVPNTSILDHELSGTAIGFEYLDVDESVSRRWVSIVAFADNLEGHPAVLCHCFLRENPRTFRVDRIINIFDERGDSHNVRDFFHVEGQASSSKNASRAYKAACKDGLRVLIAVARSDGHLDPKEVDGIIDYAKSEGKRLGLGNCEESLSGLRHYVERLQPSGSVVSECLKRLSQKDEETQSAFLKYLETIIYADGILSPSEEHFSEMIRAKLHD